MMRNKIILTILLVFVGLIESVASNNTENDIECLDGSILVTALNESFENDFGDWLQSSSDDMNWTRKSGSTGSGSTGPSGAYDGSYYIYTEASSPNYPSKSAIISSPTYDLSTISAFTFNYHMYGAAIGTIQLQVSTNGGGSWGTIWSKSGNLGDSWESETIDLSSYTGNGMLRFSATTGTNYSGDIALDNFIFTSGSVDGSYSMSLDNSENYVFTRIYQEPMMSSSEISGVSDVIEQVTYIDGLGRSKQHVAIHAGGSANSSLVSTTDWKEGSGSTPFYNQRGLTSENSRQKGTNPFGQKELLWVCGNDAASNADGGWDTNYFPVDKNSAYRYSVWVKREGSQDGKTYHGTRNVNNLNGTENDNPYFWNGDMPNLGEWYLIVGVVHPYTYGGGNSGVSGVYNSNGVKVQSGNDFKWRSTTTTTGLRSYLYYATNTSTRQYFWQPVFQKLDGTESSISDLINKSGKADVVTHIAYDGFGRQAKDHLAVPIHDRNYGAYRNSDIETVTASYYLDNFAEDFPGMTTATANPYSESLFEASPLGRIKKQASPGYDWRLGGGNEIEMEYQSNTSSEVRHYQVGVTYTDGIYEPSLSTGGYYAAGELYKTVTKDENHISGTEHTTEEFRDKQDRVVLKRTYGDSDITGDGDTNDSGETNARHDTYYVYDDYDNLTYVLPPKSEPTGSKPSLTELREICYQYKYDARNRLVEKKIPGKDWEFIVYNKLDQPILTQDRHLRDQGKWAFTKYDAFGRVIISGLLNNSATTQSTMQTKVNNYYDSYPSRTAWEERTESSSYNYYTNNSYPVLGYEVLTLNYYDNYIFDTTNQGILLPSGTSIYDKTVNYEVKGLATGTRVKVLNQSTSKWITTITHYDENGKIIYTGSYNELLGTKDLVKFDLDFTGNVLVNESTHQRIGSSDIVTTDSYDYDHMQRPTKHAQSINGSAWELISENTYDELGQLKRKDVGNATGSALQNVDFAYNVRGWLKSINNIDNIGNDLFTFELSYNNPDLSGAIGLYNGNISETIWRTANDKNATTPVSNRGYRYKYDALNRIVTATNFLNMSSSYKYRLETSYDKNGNITRLKRGGKTNYYLIDDLSYTYNAGNKLEGVSDNYTSYIVDEGFIDGNNTGYDYGYDLDGNLTSDLNKGIAVGGIEYNHLNMPTKITVSNAGSNNGVIDYVYTADGIKLQKKKTQGGVTITTDYAGDFVYENNTMKQFYQPEGYVEPDGSGWQYVYQYRDIWGNTRITYADDDNSGSVTNSEIRKEQNYYPFGLEHKGYNIASYGAENNLKTYQGQEFTGDLGLNTHEWKYRMSDPAIGRFWQIDPLAEDYTYNSTYAFQENKMGMGVELEGLDLKRFQDGLKELITGISRMISEPLNVNRQMDKNGFRQNERSEIARIESRQEMSQAVGQTAYGGSETLKGGTKTVGEGLKVSGDGITYIGIAIAQPGVVAAGETISSVGTGMNAMVDISDGKPVENVALETIVSMGFGKAGKMGVKATQKVAGKEFIKSGANKTTESIIQGTVKGYEKIFENYITPQILPEKNKIPVYGPMKD